MNTRLNHIIESDDIHIPGSVAAADELMTEVTRDHLPRLIATLLHKAGVADTVRVSAHWVNIKDAEANPERTKGFIRLVLPGLEQSVDSVTVTTGNKLGLDPEA